MTLDFNRHVSSPGDVLRKRFLEANGCSINRFALIAGLQAKVLRSILNGGLLSHASIQKISIATGTAPRYWYHNQSTWQFQEYCRSRKRVKDVEPLVQKFQASQEIKSLGIILKNRFLKPTGKSANELENLTGLGFGTLQNLITGKQCITKMIAYRLGESFGTGTKYWLDLKSGQEVNTWLATNKVDSETRDFLVRFQDKAYSIGTGRSIKTISSHPGKFLCHKFIKPSGIAVRDWQHVFCFSRDRFANILRGKIEIPVDLMFKICLVFRIAPSVLIEMQNQFYSSSIDRACKKLSRKPKKIVREPTVLNPKHPFQVLVNCYLKPMGVTVPRFMKHIGINFKRFDHSKRGRKKIDFELAIRIGQALETGSLYWVNLQLEHDINIYESKGGEGSFHLH